MNETSMSRPWAVAPPSGVEAFGAYVHWPENLDWSTQLLRAISYSSLGGSEFSEIMSAIRYLEVGDREAWLAAFSGLASELDHRAGQCAEQGHDLSAIELWRRAAIYFRMATTFHAMDGIVELPAMQESRRCFQAAMTLDPRYRFEAVKIPYEQYILPGYLISPSGPPRPRPTIVVQGGIDAFSEEMWFKLGEALVRRGYTVLLPDGPGQGESKRRGIGTRADYEVAVTAFIDFLGNRDEVDPERVALVGSSMEATSQPAARPSSRGSWQPSPGVPSTGLPRYPKGMTADVESIRQWPRLPSTPLRSSLRRSGSSIWRGSPAGSTYPSSFSMPSTICRFHSHTHSVSSIRFRTTESVWWRSLRIVPGVPTVNSTRRRWPRL